MQIINKDFKIGERYVGEINGAELEVTKIHRIPSRFKYIDVIEFMDSKTGKKFETDLEWAKRLLLKKYG